MDLLVLILYKHRTSLYTYIVQDKKHQRRSNKMDKATKIAETKAVKKALKSEGIIGASVRHEAGWIQISDIWTDNRDDRNAIRLHVVALAQKATGRYGDYHGSIQAAINLTSPV